MTGSFRGQSEGRLPQTECRPPSIKETLTLGFGMSSLLSRGDADALARMSSSSSCGDIDAGLGCVVLYPEGRLPTSESRLPSCEEIATPYV